MKIYRRAFVSDRIYQQSCQFFISLNKCKFHPLTSYNAILLFQLFLIVVSEQLLRRLSLCMVRFHVLLKIKIPFVIAYNLYYFYLSYSHSNVSSLNAKQHEHYMTLLQPFYNLFIFLSYSAVLSNQLQNTCCRTISSK